MNSILHYIDNDVRGTTVSITTDVLTKYQPLHAWLKWNRAGRTGRFINPLVREAEMDVTTSCSGLPSCARDCTYLHSRKLGAQLAASQADSILHQLRELNIRRIIFSGGGEPLESPFFLDIIGKARTEGFEIEILTNGKFLTAGIVPSLLPHLSVLRISIPPFLRGYCHLDAIHDQIQAAVEYRDKNALNMRIIASCLVQPDTPRKEIVSAVSSLTALGIDGIRFKPTHFWGADGCLHLDILRYREVTDFILSLQHPNVSVSKIDRLLSTDGVSLPFCYYADFNPFVVGSDGKNYACCEHKYHPEFQRGDFNRQSAERILSFTVQHPQLKQRGCFTGCKGDMANRLLSFLLQGYQIYGDDLFDRRDYQLAADEALVSITRSNLQT